MISTETSYHADYRNPEYLKEFKNFVKNIRKSWKHDPDALAKARKVLQDTGIADENGHVKEKIIIWD